MLIIKKLFHFILVVIKYQLFIILKQSSVSFMSFTAEFKKGGGLLMSTWSHFSYLSLQFL